MDEYELICIDVRIRHDDNDMTCYCHVVGCFVKFRFSLTPSILEIANSRLLHSIRRTNISHLRQKSL